MFDLVTVSNCDCNKSSAIKKQLTPKVRALLHLLHNFENYNGKMGGDRRVGGAHMCDEGVCHGLGKLRVHHMEVLLYFQRC